MGATPVYHRVYSQYLDGPRSPYLYYGGSQRPVGVVDGATVVGPTFHPATGSGTSPEGGQGFGQEKYTSSILTGGRPPKVFSEL
jgi:hypothetical protein